MKSMARVFPAAAIAAVVMGCWTPEPTVYTSVKAGETSAAAIDSAGTVHVAYSFNTQTQSGNGVSGVYYARGAPGGSWTEEMILDGEGSGVYADALAIAPDGTIHVLYREGRIVYHGWKSGTAAWSTEVFYDNEAGPAGAMAFDADGGMHVVHSGYKTDTVLFDNLRPFYSYRAHGGTTLTTSQISHGGGWVDVNYGRKGSIAIDSSGYAHITYGCEGNILLLVTAKLYYAVVEPDGGAVGAAVDIASATGTVDSSIGIGSDNTIHVAYLGYQSPSSKLKYLSSGDGGTTWSSAEMADSTEYSGSSPELRVDSSGGLHVGYLVQSDGTTDPVLKYAYRSGPAASWELEQVETGAYGEVDLVLDDVDSPVILYAADTGEGDYATYQELRISWKGGGTWTSQTIRDTTIPEE